MNFDDPDLDDLIEAINAQRAERVGCVAPCRRCCASPESTTHTFNKPSKRT